MRTILFFIIFIFSQSVFSQKNNKPFRSAYIYSGYMHLSNGMGSVSKAQLDISRSLNIFISAGLGYSRPKKYVDANINRRGYSENITNVFDRSHFYSFGAFVNFPLKKDKRLKILVGNALYSGVGKEEAHYLFLGNDFGDYISEQKYTQKYKYVYLTLICGLKYRLSKKWNIELSANVIQIKDKDIQGTTFFFFNDVSSFSSFRGLNLCVGYQFWNNKVIK